MRASVSFGVSHCTEFARSDQRTFALFWIWSALASMLMVIFGADVSFDWPAIRQFGNLDLVTFH